MRITNPAEHEWRTRDVKIREGQLSIKPLASGSTEDGLNFSLNLVRYGEGENRFETPRHHHTYEQVRVPISGSLNYGPKQDVPEGWVSYFPAGAYYGPQCVDGGTIVALQYGFGDDFLLPGRRRRAAGAAKMAESGSFKNGVYTDSTASGRKRNRDAVNAVYEEALGRPLEIPKPRYPAPILMDPAAFEWTASDEEPGVATKFLGAFTERDLALSMLSWPDSGTHALRSERTQLVVALSDGFVIDGQTYPAFTTLCANQGETAALSGTPDTQAIVITMPIRRGIAA